MESRAANPAVKAIQRQWLACSLDAGYFVDNYCHIYDAVKGSWIPFKMWQGQKDTLTDFQEHRLVVVLKARQLGQTWLSLCFILYLMLFKPACTALLFSRRDDEAQQLLERLRGIYQRLPDWMKAKQVVISNNHQWSLSNGSVAHAFPTTAGDSYTATIAFVDEADLVPDLDFLMNAVKPTIDNGGRMILLSRANKDTPQSPYKRIYRGAKKGETEWYPVFLPWYVHPRRDKKWYEAQAADAYARTGSYDDVWQQYPATDTEALAPKTISKRIPASWVEGCYVPMKAIESELLAVHPELQVYREFDPYHSYIVGADPALGNPTSDDSTALVMDAVTGEEVACLSEKIEPTVFAGICRDLAHAFGNGGVLVERNNHGLVVIKDLMSYGDVTLLAGPDGDPGWHTSTKSKAAIYTKGADAFRDGKVTIHTEKVYYQVCSVDGATLKAPPGEHDDCAMAIMLAIAGKDADEATGFVYSYLDPKEKAKRARESRRTVPWQMQRAR